MGRHHLIIGLFVSVVSVSLTTAQAGSITAAEIAPQPFGQAFPDLDGWATGSWWEDPAAQSAKPDVKGGRPFAIDVPRRDVIAFALYTVTVRPESRGTLKLSAQLFPLKPGEPRQARLEIKRGDAWVEAAQADVHYPGWDVNFRVDGWDSSRDWPYRVRHGEEAIFAGLIRRDPADKPTITVGVLSCNSSRSPGAREELVRSLRQSDPDLLFFAGDQTYRHTQHTVGWIEFGLQFRDVLRDRPTVTIPDDHDVGHPNLWGAGGKKAERKDGADGGYFYPADYVNMVQRQQTWHLPDPVDPEPVAQGIGVFFTRLVIGGLDCAILEDRKFKTGPFGAIPEMGPRPDHITDPSYDRASIDKPGLELLGTRQVAWLEQWGRDWKGVRAKTALSATAFAGAVHLHGSPDNRLLADLDCNGWPQSGRKEALKLLKAAHATHLCGDQHLAVVMQHGIERHGDGPWSFTSPALVNTIYGRWWHPLDEQPGANPVPKSPLPWTGDYEDGLGNKISIVAYANPEDVKDEKKRGDGYGIARFDFTKDTITFECWPRFPSVGADGSPKQYPGWPVTVPLERPAPAEQPAAAAPATRAGGPPNVLFVIADDASCHFGCYGCGWTRTPAVDRVAREGLVFDNAYVPTSKCAPCRAAILTGRNPWQLEAAANHWPTFPPDYGAFTEVLAANGVACGAAGKVWGPGVAETTAGAKRTWGLTTARRGKGIDAGVAFREFLATRTPGQPFFYWFGSQNPHRKYEPDAGVAAGKKPSDIDRVPKCWPDTDIVRRDMLDYATEIEAFDAEVGSLLAALDAAGEAENTLVIVTSDHGMPFPRIKGHTFDLAHRVPLVMRWPAGIVRPGRRSEAFVSAIDFAPTVLDLERIDGVAAGMRPITGTSLVDLLSDAPTQPRERVILGRERNDVRCRPGTESGLGYPARAIRRGNLFYVHNFAPERWPCGDPGLGLADTDAGPTKELIEAAGEDDHFWQLCFGKRPADELYDLAADPDCVQNLATNPAQAEAVGRLKAELFAALTQQEDPRLLGRGDVFDTYPSPQPVPTRARP
ncbi:MAG: sulfatase-like hydrolase/transferase [Planctomycetia bacterium]